MAKQASHKLSGLSSVITTEVPAADLTPMIETAATEARGSAMTSPGRARVESVGPSTVELSVRDAFKRELMTFSVHISADGGRTNIRTTIDSFKTTQVTAMFVPVGPKQLLGKLAYTQFLDSLEDQIRQRDRTADITRVGEA